MFNIFVNFYRQWQRLDPIQNGVMCCGFKLRDVENGVYSAEVVWRSKCKRSFSDLGR